MSQQESDHQGVFAGARTVTAWDGRGVSEETLRELFEILRWGPTSANGFPLRLRLAVSQDAKDRIAATAMASNQECLRTAPVTAIVAYDSKFFEDLPSRFPGGGEGMAKLFGGNPELAETTAFRNATLQGGYLLYAARAVGLDYAPMSGFDNAAIDSEFFPEGRIRSNFLCGLGYGDRSGLSEQPPRPDFAEICEIL